MNQFSMSFVAQFADLLTMALMHFVWQGTLLAVTLFVTVKLLRVNKARYRYLLSVGTLFVMGVAPLITAAWHYQGVSVRQLSAINGSYQPDKFVEEPSAVINFESTGHIESTVGAESSAPRNIKIEFYVMLIWLAGVVILSTRLAIGFGVTLWIRAQVKPLSTEMEQRIRVLGKRLNFDATDRVFSCIRVGQAVAVGFIRPVVLIPAAWLIQLTPDVLEAIIAHELAHIRRWDTWVNCAQRLIETLLFYHPAVWWLSRRICLEREMCCDEIAADCFERVMYAKCLETVAAMEPEHLLLTASINGGNKMNLLNRIRYLLVGVPSDSSSNMWAVGFVSFLLFIAATSVFSVSSRTVVTASSDVAAAEPVEKVEQLVIEPDQLIKNGTVQPAKIETVRVERKDVILTRRYMGLIEAKRQIEIRAAARGHLDRIPIIEGQQVKEGDLLFMVNPTSLQLKLDAERAEEKLAQLEYDYTKKLFNDKVVSVNEVDLHEAKLAKAKAKSKQAALELELAMVKAPFDGVVDRIQQQQGSLVMEGDHLTRLSDNSSVRVYFKLSDAEYFEYMNEPQKQREYQVIEMALSTGTKFSQTGKIGAIDANFDDRGRITFRADFPNPERLLRHGQRVSLLVNRTVQDAIAIPHRAVSGNNHNQHHVYVVDEDFVVHQREIVIQTDEGQDPCIVKSGLNVGDQVIVDGKVLVYEGAKLKSTNINRNN